MTCWTRLLVELERLGDVVEDAEVVDDQPMGLVRRVDAVGAGDRLQQRVLLQRLVEVLAVQDRGVEAGEQLRRDDDDLQRIGGIVEPRDDLLQLVRIRESTVAQSGGSLRLLRHHDRRGLGAEVLVELLLVGHAGGLVVDDDLSLEAPAGSTLAVKCSAMSAAILADAHGCLDQCLDRGGFLRQRDLVALATDRRSAASSSKAASMASSSMWISDRRGSKCSGSVAPSRIESRIE